MTELACDTCDYDYETDCKPKMICKEIGIEIVVDEKIDTEMTSEIVCPYCGYKFDASYECFGDEYGDGAEIETDCDSCEKGFKVTMSLSVDYSSYRKVDGD